MNKKKYTLKLNEMWGSLVKWNLLGSAGTTIKHGIDPEKDIMAGRLAESHWIFDYLKLEGVFSAALPTPRGWKGLLSGEGLQGPLHPLCAEGCIKPQG